MLAERRRSIFELSVKEREERLKPLVEAVLKKAETLNIPVVYRNVLCTKPNQFIHKYPDGKTLLVEQDGMSLVEHAVSVLH